MLFIVQRACLPSPVSPSTSCTQALYLYVACESGLWIVLFLSVFRPRGKYATKHMEENNIFFMLLLYNSKDAHPHQSFCALPLLHHWAAY